MIDDDGDDSVARRAAVRGSGQDQDHWQHLHGGGGVDAALVD